MTIKALIWNKTCSYGYFLQNKNSLRFPSGKLFIEKNTSFYKGMNLTTLVKALSFLFAFKQIFDTYLPNLRLLFIGTRGSSTSLHSKTIS